MPKHNPPELRSEVLRWLAKGHDSAEASDVFGIPRGTIDSWISRYGLPDPPQTEDDDDEQGDDDDELASDLDRVEYLTRAVDELGADIQACRAAGGWSSMSTLRKTQNELHAQRVDVLRAEGSRLDLTEDPRAMALAIEAAGDLLRMLATDLDGDPSC